MKHKVYRRIVGAISALVLLLSTNDCIAKTQTTVESIDQEVIRIDNFEYPQGTYFSEQQIPVMIRIQNSSIHKTTVGMVLQVVNSMDETVYEEKEYRSIGYGKSVQVIKWKIPEEVVSGVYRLRVDLWEIQEQKSRFLEQRTSGKTITCFRIHEEFQTLDPSQWVISDKELGLTDLKKKNVFIEDGRLQIRMSQGRLDGGEIATADTMQYGVYEIKMKLPDVPSSITGFFLYGVPDYDNEIDIEVYNQPDGSLMATTYAEGKVQNTYTSELLFDPTEDYHSYRIEYQKDNVTFQVDGNIVISFKEQFTRDEMNLYVNTWYPNWLEGKAALTEQYLQVDWINY